VCNTAGWYFLVSPFFWSEGILEGNLVYYDHFMDTYSIFLDESGLANIQTYQRSPYFTVCGLVISEPQREKVREDLENLKLKYFGKKDFILHIADLKTTLEKEKQQAFIADLDKLLKQNRFFLLLATVDKEKAATQTWTQNTAYRYLYRSITGNLVKFLVAKKAIGHIVAEASNAGQDNFIYQSFFHFVGNGIKDLGIRSTTVKNHLRSVSFVTKTNNDPEEQLADLFGVCGALHMRILKGEKKEENLDPLEKVLYKHMKDKFFGKNGATDPKKVRLYGEISSFVSLPFTSTQKPS